MNQATARYRKTAKTDDCDDMIVDNIDFVRKVLSTMTIAIRDEDEKENLNSAGLVGLVQAAQAFDSTQGTMFQTFAFPRIRGAILDELRKLSPVSQTVLKKIGQIKRAYQNLKPPVLPEDLSRETDLPLVDVEKCLEAMRFLKPQDWNDLHCTIHSSWRNEPGTAEHELERSEMKALLADGIEQLDDLNRNVVVLYYHEELTMAEIGDVLNVSESHVSRTLAVANFRLQEYVRQRTS